LAITHREKKVMALFNSKKKLLSENRSVKYVLLLKITYTVIGIISYLVFPKSLILYLGLGTDESIRFLRSLGLAYIGLLFVYCSGYFLIIKKNKYPINVVLFGIVMNGGGFILSVIFMIIDLVNNTGFKADLIRYVMLFLFFVIALMLIISLVRNYKRYKNDIIWNILWSKQS
jgi:hypothetical protein